MMAEMITETVKWAISIGTAGIVLVFVGAVVWSVTFGYKSWPGVLNIIEAKRHKHEDEQTAMRGDADTAVKKAEVSAFNLATDMTVVADAQKPPLGPAWIAQGQVAQMAITVEQLKLMGKEFISIARLMATKLPDIRLEIEGHCDTVERETLKIEEAFLREQEKAKGKTP